MPIEPIPEIPPEFARILPTGKLIVFLGAGVSRLLHYPSWIELSDRALKHLTEDPKTRFSYADLDILKALNPRQKLSIAMDIWEEAGKKPKELIEKAIAPTQKSSSRIYDLLISLNTAFITTNYDLALLNATPQKATKLEDVGDMSKAQSVAKPERIPYSLREQFLTTILADNKSIVYLHGRLSDESPLIVTTRNYVDHYGNEKVKNFLTHLFNNYNVLFIGYGLDEEELIDFIVRKKPDGEEKATMHFRLTPAYSHEAQLISHLDNYYRKQCQVRLVPYLIDGNGHSQLEKVLEKWIPAIKAIIKPVSFTDKTKMILDPVITHVANS